MREKKILQNDCPFLVHLHWALQTEEYCYLVMDFVGMSKESKEGREEEEGGGGREREKERQRRSRQPMGRGSRRGKQQSTFLSHF